MASEDFRITLKAARINSGCRMKDAAAALGVSITTLSRWENRHSTPRSDQFLAMCDLYSVSPAQVIL